MSDGRQRPHSSNFDITVNQIALGSATLSWKPPTENADGSALTDLAGYRSTMAAIATISPKSVVLNNPGLTRYVVENLSPAKWYFAMTSVNSNGVESDALGDCVQDDQLNPRTD